MKIRRPVVSVLTALALLGGGAALSGCSDTEGLGQRTGTTKDDAQNLSGNDPTSVEQGSLYNRGVVTAGEEVNTPEGG